MTLYRPAAGQHAIDQAVVGIRIFDPVSDGHFKQVIQQAAELAIAHDLPGRVQLDAMSIAFGRQVISHGMVTNAELHPGMLFQRVNADGSMAEEMTIERTAVTYRTRSYKRWKDIEDILNGIVYPVAASLAQNDLSKISVVELRCIDRFISEPSDRPGLSSLVREDCPYVSSHLIDRPSQLHLHSGWFEDETDAGRTLFNINIDVADQEDGSRAANILQSISLHYARDLGASGTNGDFPTVLTGHFATLHAKDKKLLANILTDSLKDQINLAGSTGL